jgi:hypothetical protein
MLLSMYASYHWARLGKEDWFFSIFAFIVLMSFISTSLTYLGFFLAVLFFLWPLLFASYPFMGIVVWRRSFGVVAGYDIRFFALRIVSLPTEYAPLLGFGFFLLVNLAGALLGYWIGTRYRIQLFGSKWWKVLWGLIGITSIILGLLFARAFGAFWYINEDFGVALFSFGIAVFETIILSYLLNNWTSIISVKQ